MPHKPAAARLARLPFFYGWVVVAVAFVTMGVGVNSRTAFSLLFPPILDEFGWSRGAVAGIFSIGFVASMLLAPATGVLMDRFGPRWLLPGGTALTAAGLVLATIAVRPWHFYATLGAMVIAGSIVISYIGHSLFLPNWFSRRRGLALGIAFSGVGFGSITLLPWLQRIIEEDGWRRACWVLAALLIVVVVPLNIAFQRKRPEALGLAPDGARGANSGRDPGGTETHIDRTIVDAQWAARDWTLPMALRTTRFWWLFGGYFCGLYVWYAVQVHQTRYLLDAGFDATQAAFALGLVGFGGIIGQIAIGHFSDRIGREWGWTLSYAGYIACYALLIAIAYRPTLPFLYLMVAAQGVLGYGMASVFGAIPADIFQGRHYGAIFGALNVASGLGAGTGPWLTGVIFDRTGSYALAFWLAMALSLVAILCIWRAAPRRVRLVAGRAGN